MSQDANQFWNVFFDAKSVSQAQASIEAERRHPTPSSQHTPSASRPIDFKTQRFDFSELNRPVVQSAAVSGPATRTKTPRTPESAVADFITSERLKNLDSEISTLSKSISRIQTKAPTIDTAPILQKLDRLEKSINSLSEILLRQPTPDPKPIPDQVIESQSMKNAVDLSEITERLDQLDKKLTRTGTASARAYAEVKQLKQSLDVKPNVTPEVKSTDHSEFHFDLLDSLDRAIDSVGPGASEDSERVISGLRMTQAKILEELAKSNIEPIATTGQFSPMIHKAAGLTPAKIDSEKNTIARVIRRGFKRGDAVLRLALVTVYK